MRNGYDSYDVYHGYDGHISKIGNPSWIDFPVGNGNSLVKGFGLKGFGLRVWFLPTANPQTLNPTP
jgi:hypothetical protein